MDLEGEELIELNVSGRIFVVTQSTLLSQECSYFTGLLSGRLPTIRDANGRIFINRPARAFEIILTFLQTGKLYLPNSPSFKRLVIDECDFYGIPIDLNDYQQTKKQSEDEKQCNSQ
jgi:hypothetical protein